MLKEIFRIISFYDKIRWSWAVNDSFINFYKKDLDDDTKLLTHWLCYITDRQMAFERIWDVGGFVFSELVYSIKKDKRLELLDPDIPTAFIGKKNHDGYAFRSNTFVNENQILRLYGFKSTDKVEFTSRYYPSDYFSILYTFDILKKYDFSFTKFIVEQLRNHHKKEDYIKRLLFSLYLLSYSEIGQPNKLEIADFQKNIKKAESRTNKILQILNNRFEEEYSYFKKGAIFYQKRAWCSLRDYFKSPELKEYFKRTLYQEAIGSEQQDELFSLKSLKQFELPGDVWNNNSKFRNCILKGSEYENSNESLNVILRDYFDKNETELEGCYPEQFDVTFDFIPRMCQSYNCNICPIGLLKGEKGLYFKKSCVNNKILYCSVALTNCNYKIDCFGSDCDLIKNIISNP